MSISGVSAIQEQKKNARQESKNQGKQQTRKNREAAIMTAIRRFPNGETKTTIKEATGLNAKNFNAIFEEWVGSGKVEPCIFDRGEKKTDESLKTYAGFKLVEQPSQSKPDTQTPADNLGHCPTVSA